MSSKFKESIDQHVTSTALHIQSSVDGKTLVFSEPTLTTDDNASIEAESHIARKEIHLTGTVSGKTLVLFAEPSTDFISHAADDTIHHKIVVKDGVISFAAQAMSGDLVDLEKYVPQFVREMGEMHQIYKSQGMEIAREWLKLEDVDRQMFPDDATWSISLWETNYGVKSYSGSSLASRRKAVIARLTVPPTTTLALVQKTAEEIIGGTIWVEEEPEKSHINIWLMDRTSFNTTWSDVNDQGSWSSIQDYTWMKVITDLTEDTYERNQFLDWLDTYKPAHLGYTLDYFTMRWKDVLEYTWRDLTDYTWLGVLMGLKQFATTWRLAMETAGTWSGLDNSYTWYTTNKIKENS